MNYPFKMYWGSASADFQYEGGFNEGKRGLITHDIVTDGSYTTPRRLTYRLPDGTLGSVAYRESFPEGAVGVFTIMFIILVIMRLIFIITIKRILSY